MSYGKNIISTIAFKSIGVLVGFSTSVITARSVNVGTQGDISYYMLWLGAVATYGTMGITQGYAYFRKVKNEEPQILFSQNIVFSLLVLVVELVIVGLVGVFPIHRHWVFSLAVIFEALSMISVQELIASEKIGQMNWMNLVSQLVLLAEIVILSLVGKLDLSAYLFAKAGSLLVLFLGMTFFAGIRFSMPRTFTGLLPVLKYGMVVYLASLFGYLNYRLDQYLIKANIGADQLGLYSIGVNFSEFILIVPTSISLVLTSRLYNLQNKDDRRSALRKTLMVNSIVMLLMIVVGLVGAPSITLIYGTKYQASIGVFRILLIASFFSSIGRVVYPITFVEGVPKIHLLLTFLAFAVNLVLNLVLIPVFGIVGAAWASVGSYFLYGAGYIVVLRGPKFGVSLASIFRETRNIDFKKLMVKK